MVKPLAIGVDLGATNIKIALVDRGGQILRRSQTPTEAQAGVEKILKKLSAEIKKLIHSAGIEFSELAGLGIGVPGLVDDKTGIVRSPPNLKGWDEVPLKQYLEEQLLLSTFLENDVNAVTIGEKEFGVAKGIQNFVCITLGTGVGGGVVINGNLYRGSLGSAGEIGHITIDRNGPRCNCGNWGCLERFVGAQYIVERAIRKLKLSLRDRKKRGTILWRLIRGDWKQLNPKIISQAARLGDELALEVLRETGIFLGIGLASIVNLLNPEMIVIGGGVAKAGRILFAEIRKTVRSRAFALPAKFVKIVPSKLKDDAGILGVITIVFGKC